MTQIAVIMPTYNGARFVAEAALSVLRQTGVDWTLTVIDDGSTDGGAGAAEVERIAAHPDAAGRVRLIRSATNLGIAAARNRAFHEAVSGGDAPEYVLFLDHDDVLEANALSVLRAAAEAMPGCSGAHGVCSSITADGQPHESSLHFSGYQRTRLTLSARGRLRALAPEEPTDALAFAVRNFIPTPGVVLIRRAAFEAVGGFDPAAAPADDWDIWLRLTRQGTGLAFLPDVVLGYRIHDSNASRHKSAMSSAERLVWQKAVTDPTLPAAQRDALRRAYRATNLHQCAERLGTTALHLRRGAVRQSAQEFLRAGRRLGRALAGSPA